jgi:FAD/FMN-containing dehydrogenase
VTDESAPRVSGPSPATPAPTERGWGKLLIAIAVFLFLPTIPQLRAVLPIEQTIVLFAPAVAACALVGWWAGGRAFLALAWVAIAVLLTVAGTTTGAKSAGFDNLARGWSLLLAGSFGLVCLLGMQRPLFTRALIALAATLGLAAIMSLVGPVSASQASKTVAAEFARRNAETMSTLNGVIASHQDEWNQLASKVPQLADLPTETDKELSLVSGWGRTVFPALLALQSLAALALAWATYHRLGRARLGAPLKPLREFRFNDQLVWGLIVGLTILLLPTMTPVRDLGKNLLVFFGALYAIRGLGVLTWFMAPGSLGVALAVAFVLLWAPVLNAFAALAFMTLAVAALALGLGDTWADWRSRARSTM